MSAVKQEQQSSSSTTMSSTAPTTKKNAAVAKALEPFVCGGAAATFASIVIHPIDLAKVSYLYTIVRRPSEIEFTHK
jgi:hypothetical protein